MFFLRTWSHAQSLPNTVQIISEHKIVGIQILDDSVSWVRITVGLARSKRLCGLWCSSVACWGLSKCFLCPWDNVENVVLCISWTVLQGRLFLWPLFSHQVMKILTVGSKSPADSRAYWVLWRSSACRREADEKKDRWELLIQFLTSPSSSPAQKSIQNCPQTASTCNKKTKKN